METPFNIIIVGMTGCGKTHHLLNMLEKEYFGHFEYIVIICPTFSLNKTYQNWKYIHDDDLIPMECTQDQVNDVLHIVSEIYKGTNTLIIIDDCAASQDVKNRSSSSLTIPNPVPQSIAQYAVSECSFLALNPRFSKCARSPIPYTTSIYKSLLFSNLFNISSDKSERGRCLVNFGLTIKIMLSCLTKIGLVPCKPGRNLNSLSYIPGYNCTYVCTMRLVVHHSLSAGVRNGVLK